MTIFAAADIVVPQGFRGICNLWVSDNQGGAGASSRCAVRSAGPAARRDRGVHRLSRSSEPAPAGSHDGGDVVPEVPRTSWRPG